MTYQILNSLRWGKRPIWLYQFTLPNGNDIFRTSALATYTDPDAIDWDPMNVAHTRIRKTSVGERAQTTLIFPATDTVAQLYLDDVNSE